jgi:hypothetical protein
MQRIFIASLTQTPQPWRCNARYSRERLCLGPQVAARRLRRTPGLDALSLGALGSPASAGGSRRSPAGGKLASGTSVPARRLIAMDAPSRAQARPARTQATRHRAACVLTSCRRRQLVRFPDHDQRQAKRRMRDPAAASSAREGRALPPSFAARLGVLRPVGHIGTALRRRGARLDDRRASRNLPDT